MKVLIVDDEEKICKRLQRELQKEGYDIDYTTTSVGVLEKLMDAEKKDYAAYELLLLDLRMPEIDGLTLLKKIREAQLDLDVIIITAFGDVDKAIESIRLGAIDYLRKPISLEELRTAIFRVQQKRAAEEKMPLEHRILVVDDEKDVCKRIKRELEKVGYKVAVAHDGVKGLDYFKNNHVDLVLADIKMPRMNGLEMLEKCSEIKPDFVPIVITGVGDYEKAIDALKLGVFDYLKKPISLEELITTVNKGFELLGLRRSLSARKRELELERALKELELQQLKILNMILELAADGIMVIDMDFNIIQVNETFAKMTGVSKEDAVGKKCYEVFSMEFCHTERCSLTQLLKGRTYIEDECEMERAEGSKIPCLVVAKPYKSLDGELIGIMEDFRDITERKKAEDALRLSEKKYHAVVENSVDEIMMIDKDGRYLAVNTCAASSAGLKPDDMVNKTLWELFPGGRADTLFEPCKQVFATKKATSQITHLRNVLGRGFKWVHSIIAPVLNENKDVDAVVIISRDITRQKEIEQELKETASQLTSIMDSATEHILAAYALNKKLISERHFE
ncbi:MAG: response regulator [Halobacteriota archaeon]